MNARKCFAFLLAFALLLGVYTPAHADGIIIPDPHPCPGGDCPPRPMAQLVIRYHHVEVHIVDQVAVTRVDQVFYNPNDWVVEGSYVFPLPLDAAVSDFTLWVDGQPVKGELLDADRARQTYESIVRELRDPALLEYLGRGAFQLKVFPIPPGGERRVELQYSQVLPAENGLVRYRYPLNTEKFSALPLESVSVSVAISSQAAIRAVYSPTHAVDVSRKDDFQALASFEAANLLPDNDFSLYYSIGKSEAFHLFSYRDASDPFDPDGFFLLLLAPEAGQQVEAVRKDVILVLDRSGSMEGEKFRQAQAAIRFILKNLQVDDRFYLMSFSSSIQTYAERLRPAGRAEEAIRWVDSLSASGSTDIHRALLEAAAIADRERLTYLIFVTDGLPTEGVTNSQQILKDFAAAAPPNLRLYAFGVGYDVDTYLLDLLSQEHHGLSAYVKPGDALDEIISSFYERVSAPLLTNLKLDFSLPVYDLYPSPLPDLFAGSQVVLVGRYRQGGALEVTMSGEANGETKTYRFSGQNLMIDNRQPGQALKELPRLWATRKIGDLLSQIRLHGADKETVDQIVRLSIRYGIVTPYTSYLVTEPGALGAENIRRLAADTYSQMQAMPTAPAYGQAAVEKAAGQGAMSQADAAPAVPVEAGQQVRAVGHKAFVLQGSVWVDTAYDAGKMQPRKIIFLSSEYFSLARSNADLAAAFALGTEVIVVNDGRVYQVVEK